MKPGVRGRLFLISTALMLVVLVSGGAALEATLRSWVRERQEGELERLAGAVRVLVEQRGLPVAGDPALADLATTTGARVSVITAGGRVLADTAVPDEQIAALEPHGGRSEVREALAGRVGVARRDSATIGRELLYVAVAGESSGGRFVARAATTAEQGEEVAGRLRGALVAAGLLALALAFFMSGLASHLTFRTIRTLVDAARTIADARGGRVPLGVERELGSLAGPINAIARELEQVVETLARERNRTEAVLHGLSDAVLALDSSFRITLANPAATALLGATASPEGRTLAEAIRVPALQELATRAMAEGACSLEVALPGAGAQGEPQKPPRRVHVRATPLRDGEGVVLVLHDVTELRRLETIRRDFVANVSHELRTPLSVIRANTETLLDGAGEDPVGRQRFLGGILRHVERLSALVRDLLDLSRIEEGHAHLQAAPVPVAQAAAVAVGYTADAAQRKRITVHNEVHPSLEVLADSLALEQVLVNLVDNAVKYTQPGGSVTVRAHAADPGRLRIEVEDDGPGIEPKHRDRVFERFYRVDPGRSRDMGGTGLGLSIVRHMVEVMGGRVGVEPASPRGSLFWVLLPRP